MIKKSPSKCQRSCARVEGAKKTFRELEFLMVRNSFLMMSILIDINDHFDGFFVVKKLTKMIIKLIKLTIKNSSYRNCDIYISKFELYKTLILGFKFNKFQLKLRF